MFNGGPIVNGINNALCHFPLERDGGVEEVGGCEEETDGGDSCDGTGEAGCKTGQARPDDGDEMLGEIADGLEVDEEEDGKGGKEDGVD